MYCHAERLGSLSPCYRPFQRLLHVLDVRPSGRISSQGPLVSLPRFPSREELAQDFGREKLLATPAEQEGPDLLMTGVYEPDLPLQKSGGGSAKPFPFIRNILLFFKFGREQKDGASYASTV